MKTLFAILFIVVICSSFQIKDRIVKGKVTDNNGKPLSGVIVLSCYQAGNGLHPDKKTVTDTKGHYRIKISNNDKCLDVSYPAFGYTKVITITGGKNMDIVLYETPLLKDTILIGKNSRR